MAERYAPWPISRVYAAGIILAGLLAWLSWLPAYQWPDAAGWRAVASLAALGVLAEFTTVSLPSGGVISTAFAVVMTTMLLFGPFPAIAVAGLSILFNTCLRRRRPLFLGFFNTGQYALSYSVAAGVLYLLQGGPAGEIVVSPFLILSTTLATLSYVAVSSLLVNLYVHLDQGVPWDKKWWHDDRWESLLIIVLSPLAVLMASLYDTLGQPGLLLPFLPVLVIGYFVKSLLDSHRASEQLADFTRQLALLHSIACKINAQSELKQVFALIVSELHRVIDYHHCDVYLLNKETGCLSPQVGGEGTAALGAAVDPLGLVLRTGMPMQAETTLRLDELIALPDLPSEWQQFRSLLAAPIVFHQGPIGVLCLLHRDAGAFTADHEQLISLLAHQAATAIENAQLLEELQNLAITDAVTGIFNHRYFTEQLDAELRRVPRYGHQLAIILLDVDHFKRFNDTHGHLLGDQALRDIGVLLKATLRETDVVARYGGEEFGIILPYASPEQASEVAERLRRRVSEFPFQGREGPVQVTVSLGIASYATGNVERRAIVDLADRALYRAKNTGRNRVVRAVLQDPIGGEFELIEADRLEEPPLRIMMFPAETGFEQRTDC